MGFGLSGYRVSKLLTRGGFAQISYLRGQSDSPPTAAATSPTSPSGLMQSSRAHLAAPPPRAKPELQPLRSRNADNPEPASPIQVERMQNTGPPTSRASSYAGATLPAAGFVLLYRCVSFPLTSTLHAVMGVSIARPALTWANTLSPAGSRNPQLINPDPLLASMTLSGLPLGEWVFRARSSAKSQHLDPEEGRRLVKMVRGRPLAAGCAVACGTQTLHPQREWVRCCTDVCNELGLRP